MLLVRPLVLLLVKRDYVRVKFAHIKLWKHLAGSPPILGFLHRVLIGRGLWHWEEFNVDAQLYQVVRSLPRHHLVLLIPRTILVREQKYPFIEALLLHRLELLMARP